MKQSFFFLLIKYLNPPFSRLFLFYLEYDHLVTSKITECTSSDFPPHTGGVGARGLNFFTSDVSIIFITACYNK